MTWYGMMKLIFLFLVAVMFLGCKPDTIVKITKEQSVMFCVNNSLGIMTPTIGGGPKISEGAMKALISQCRKANE